MDQLDEALLTQFQSEWNKCFAALNRIITLSMATMLAGADCTEADAAMHRACIALRDLERDWARLSPDFDGHAMAACLGDDSVKTRQHCLLIADHSLEHVVLFAESKDRAKAEEMLNWMTQQLNEEKQGA